MCFYVKKHLDYKPYVKPSYKVAREAEAVKEKQREKEEEAARMNEKQEREDLQRFLPAEEVERRW